MSRSVIFAAAAVLFCVSSPRVAQAQRVTPRRSIVPKPADSAAKSRPVAGDSVPAFSVAPGTGSIMGTVVDSLNDQMLSISGVTIHGLPNRHAVTNGNGAFRIDSIPPGKYVLELTHPLLDSLGIRVVSDTVPVTAGQVQVVEMAVPGPGRIINTVCPPEKLRFGPGVILGRVSDADTEQPAIGAEVSVAWMQTEVNPVVGVQSTPRLRKSTVAADGTYRICGVPDDFVGTIQANRGTAKTAEVPIKAVNEPLSIRMLSLPPEIVAMADTTQRTATTGTTTTGTATTGTATTGTTTTGSAGDTVTARAVRPVGRAVIRGLVTNAGGVPVGGARVSVQGSPSSVSTNPDGTFTLTGVLPGTQSVLVRRVGYTPVARPIDVTSKRTNELTVRLGSYTPALSSVEVTGKSDPLEATGFERRRKIGFGRFVDLDQINKIHPTLTTDILRRIPGLFINGSGPSASLATTRGMGCVSYLIDNTPVQPGAGQSIDEIIKSQDIAAVEYYNPVDVPLELSAGSDGCSLLVIWSKGKMNNKKKK